MTSTGSEPKNTVASRRLRNSGVNTRSSAFLPSLLSADRVAEADRAGRHLAAARVARHDQDDVAEVALAAVVVGQRRVVHHLEQDVVDVGVRLLDLVEQHDRVRVLVDRVGELAALIEADVARRRADQPRHRVLLHVLRHVEPDELDAEHARELLGELGLADAGRAREQEAAGRLVRVAEARARQLDHRRELLDRRVLAVDQPLELAFEVLRACVLSAVDTERVGMRAIFATTSSIRSGRISSGRASGAIRRTFAPASSITSIALSGRCEPLMWRVAQLDRGLDRGVGELDVVVLLVARLEALQDLDRLGRPSARRCRCAGTGATARDRARTPGDSP